VRRQCQQAQITDDETERRHGPGPFAPDPVGQMAERDLADHARQPDEAEGERGELGP
jgi:hypothetical protein